MHCKQCGVEVRPQAKFCEHCGAPARRACAACGADVSPKAHYCSGCGSRLTDGLAAPGFGTDEGVVTTVPAFPPAQPSVRQTTVMMCDLVDSTALTNSLDPEDTREVLRRFLDESEVVIRRHNGYVARYMGDGFLAYFGYPQAHEDDAERAVRAGLDIISAVQALSPLPDVHLEVRVGIATGVVVVGDVLGEGAAREAAVTGPTPNLAARLQGIAMPSTVVISPTTRKLVGNLFDCIDLGSLQLKGFTQPVNGWKVTGERSVESHFEAIHPEISLTPLVGREQEMALLLERWRLASSGAGQVVVLSGEPGIGKSRLSRELLDIARKGACTVIRYYCAPRFQNTALHPLIGFFERTAGFAREDSPAVKLAKLEAMIARAVPPEQMAGSVPYIAALLSIPFEHRYVSVVESPERQKERLLAALRAQTAGLARQQPVLMICEDLHWADPTTMEVIAQFVEENARLPVLFVMTTRPAAAPAWSGQAHVLTLELTRLPRVSGAAIVSYLASGKPLPAPILEQILSRSDGVPLFTEELTKAVLESGALAEQADHFALSNTTPGLTVPSSLNDSLMARLDRLSTVKEVAQVGAAIGREFSHELLAAVLPIGDLELQTVLSRLMEADLIQVRGTAPDAIYAFRHALIHDAAYTSMLRGKRQTLHAEIAEAIEARGAGEEGVEPEVLAHHWTAAAVLAKAIPYWQQAGMRAGARAANAEATNHFRAALELLVQLPEDPVRQQLELGLRVQLGLSLAASRGYAAPEVEAAYRRARELCHALGDTAELFPVIRGLCTFYIVRCNLAAALELARQCVRLGEDTGRPDYQIEGYTALGYIIFYGGDLNEAITLLSRAVEIYRGNAGESLQYPSAQDPCVASLCLLSHALCLQGKLTAARRTAGEVIALVERLRRPFEEAYARGYLAMFETLMANPTTAIQHAQRAIAVSQEHGFVIWLGIGHVQLAVAMAALGDPKTASGILEAASAAFLASGAELGSPFMLAWIARVHWALGDPDKALTTVEHGLAFSARTGERYMDSDLYRLRGEICAQRSEGQLARAAIMSALKVARQQNARLFELRAALSLVESAEDTESGDARQLLRQALATMDGGTQDSPDLARAAAALERRSQRPD